MTQTYFRNFGSIYYFKKKIFCVVIYICIYICIRSVGSVSASRTVGHEFASRPGHTEDHHKNGTNCPPA